VNREIFTSYGIRINAASGRGGSRREPGIERPRSPEVAPDLLGWRKERMPALPSGPIPIVPDGVCEVPHPERGTRNNDQT
jgi:hypothetical protein